MSLSKSPGVGDGQEEAWHAAVHGVTRIGHDWATKLNWTDHFVIILNGFLRPYPPWHPFSAIKHWIYWYCVCFNVMGGVGQCNRWKLFAQIISTNARTDKRNRLKNTCFFLSFSKRLVSISNILKQFLSFLQKEGLNIHVNTTVKSIIVE